MVGLTLNGPITGNTKHRCNISKLLVSQVLSNANINACNSFRTLEVRNMVNEVYTNIGTKIDINEFAFEPDFNVVMSMLWVCSKYDIGNDSSDILDGFREVEFKIIELLGAPNISDFILMLSWFDLQGKKRE